MAPSGNQALQLYLPSAVGLDVAGTIVLRKHIDRARIYRGTFSAQMLSATIFLLESRLPSAR